jgi:hypothetical protein
MISMHNTDPGSGSTLTGMAGDQPCTTTGTVHGRGSGELVTSRCVQGGCGWAGPRRLHCSRGFPSSLCGLAMGSWVTANGKVVHSPTFRPWDLGPAHHAAVGPVQSLGRGIGHRGINLCWGLGGAFAIAGEPHCLVRGASPVPAVECGGGRVNVAHDVGRDLGRE